MDKLEFYDRYRLYSTADLIKIVRERDGYQPAAVLAAEQLLQEREVSSVDEEEADQYFREKEAERMAATARVDSYKAAVADWVEPLARPSADLQPYKWYRIFLVLYGALFGWELFGFARHLIRARSISLELEPLMIDWINLLWVALIFLLVARRNRWGWILFVGQSAALVLMYLVEFGFLFKYIWRFNPGSLLFTIFYHLALLAFLWRRQMAEFFGVTPAIKWRTLGVGAVIGALFSLYFALR